MPDDRAALADVAAGRLTASDAVARRLGGWHLARDDGHDGGREDGAPGSSDGASGSHAATSATALLWTDTALATYDRLHELIEAIDAAGERRFTATIVRAMVHLIVDGYPFAPPFGDISLFPGLALRLHRAAAGIVVLDLRPGASPA